MTLCKSLKGNGYGGGEGADSEVARIRPLGRSGSKVFVVCCVLFVDVCFCCLCVLVYCFVLLFCLLFFVFNLLFLFFVF